MKMSSFLASGRQNTGKDWLFHTVQEPELAGAGKKMGNSGSCINSESDNFRITYPQTDDIDFLMLPY